MVYSSYLSEALVEAGADVLGVALERNPPAALPETGVRWDSVAERRRGLLSAMANPLPFTVFSHRTSGFRSAVRDLLAGQPFDVVIMDHLQAGWLIDELGGIDGVASGRPKVVYLSHNYETDVRAAVAKRERAYSPRKAVLGLDALKTKRLERRVIARADLVTAITDADARAFTAAGAADVVTITPGWSGEACESRMITESVPRRVVVLGHWEWHVKQTNLERFLEAADPLFHAAGAEIVVLGPAPVEWVARLSAGLAATRFAGWVDDFDVELSQARVGIVAEPAGGGFKLKSLDYVFGRLPMAVLEGSVAGLPLNGETDIIVRADEESLAMAALDALDDLSRLNQMQSLAFEACQSLRGWAEPGRILRKALDSHAGA